MVCRRPDRLGYVVFLQRNEMLPSYRAQGNQNETWSDIHNGE